MGVVGQLAALGILIAVVAAAPSLGDAADDGYDEHEALTAAYLATAAYCGVPRTTRASLESWRCGPACDHVPGVTSVRQVISDDARWVEAAAYVGWWKGKCLVAFRGTADKTEWFEDLRSGWHADPTTRGIHCSHANRSCYVGSGWLSAYGSIRNYVHGNLSAIGCHPGSKVVMTGHSLGGAAAQLAMFDLSAMGYDVQRSFVFGSPRTGDSTWAAAFEERLGNASVYRVTFRRDPVVHVPPMDFGFVNSQVEVFYNGNLAAGYRKCDRESGWGGCSGQYTSLAELIAGCVARIRECDHLQYMRAVKQIPMDGASCVDHEPAVEVHV